VTVLVQDRGGGIPLDEMSKIWTYLYTTAKPPQELADNTLGGLTHAPMVCFGYFLCPASSFVVFLLVFFFDLTRHSFQLLSTSRLDSDTVFPSVGYSLVTLEEILR